eukprot:3464855-Rhodomonas_salina.1
MQCDTDGHGPTKIPTSFCHAPRKLNQVCSEGKPESATGSSFQALQPPGVLLQFPGYHGCDARLLLSRDGRTLTGRCTRVQDCQFQEGLAAGMPSRLRKVLSMQFRRSQKEEDLGCVRPAFSPMLSANASDYPDILRQIAIANDEEAGTQESRRRLVQP